MDSQNSSISRTTESETEIPNQQQDIVQINDRFEVGLNETEHQLQKLSTANSTPSFQNNSDDLGTNFRLRQKSSSFHGFVCRICRLTSNTAENLESPCNCKGTIGLVHISCLERWLSESRSNRCEICRYEFKVNRILKFSWLGGLVRWLLTWRTNLDARQLLFLFAYFVFLTPVVIACLVTFGMWLTLVHNINKDTNLDVPITILFGSMALIFVLNILLIAHYKEVYEELKYQYGVFYYWWINNYDVQIFPHHEKLTL